MTAQSNTGRVHVESLFVRSERVRGSPTRGELRRDGYPRVGGAGAIPVSRTVREVAAGYAAELGDRRRYDVEGVPGAWRVWSAAV
jgi:hypothetical protein